MTPSEGVVRQRIASLFREILNERGLTYAQSGIPRQRAYEITHGTTNCRLSTLIQAAEALDCDLVINLRERRRP